MSKVENIGEILNLMDTLESVGDKSLFTVNDGERVYSTDELRFISQHVLLDILEGTK